MKITILDEPKIKRNYEGKNIFDTLKVKIAVFGSSKDVVTKEQKTSQPKSGATLQGAREWIDGFKSRFSKLSREKDNSDKVQQADAVDIPQTSSPTDTVTPKKLTLAEIRAAAYPQREPAPSPEPVTPPIVDANASDDYRRKILADLYNKPEETWTEEDFKLQAKAKSAFKRGEGPDPEFIKLVVQAEKEVERAKAVEKTNSENIPLASSVLEFDRKNDGPKTDETEIVWNQGEQIGRYGFVTMTDTEPPRADRIKVFLVDNRVKGNAAELLFVSGETAEANQGLTNVIVPEVGKTYTISHGELEAKLIVRKCHFSKETGEFLELKMQMVTAKKAQENNDTVSFEPKAVVESVTPQRKALFQQKLEARAAARRTSEEAAKQASQSATPEIDTYADTDTSFSTIKDKPAVPPTRTSLAEKLRQKTDTDTDTSVTTVEEKPAVPPSRTRLIDRVQQKAAKKEYLHPLWDRVMKNKDAQPQRPDVPQPRLFNKLRPQVNEPVASAQENLSPQEERVISQRSYDHIDGVIGVIREKILVDGKEVGEYGYHRLESIPGAISIWLHDKITDKKGAFILLPEGQTVESKRNDIDQWYSDYNNMFGVIPRQNGAKSNIEIGDLKLTFNISNVSHERFTLNAEVTQKKTEAQPIAQPQDVLATTGSSQPLDVRQGVRDFVDQTKGALRDGAPWSQVVRDVASTFDPRPGVRNFVDQSREALEDGVPWSQVAREVVSTFSPKSIKEKVREMKDKLTSSKVIGWLVIDNWREKRQQKAAEELARRSMDPAEQQRVAQQAQESLRTSNLPEGQRGWLNTRLGIDLLAGLGGAAIAYQMNQHGIDSSLVRNLLNVVAPSIGVIGLGINWLLHSTDKKSKDWNDSLENSSKVVKFLLKNVDIMFAFAAGLGLGAGISGMQDAIERADFSQTAQEMPEPPAIPTATQEPTVAPEATQTAVIEPTIAPEFTPNPNEVGVQPIEPASDIPLDESLLTPRPVDEIVTLEPTPTLEATATIEPTATPEPTATVEPVEVVPTVEPTQNPEPPAETTLRDLTQDPSVYSETYTPPPAPDAPPVLDAPPEEIVVPEIVDAAEQGTDVPPVSNETVDATGTWDSYDSVVNESVGDKTLWRSISDHLDEANYLNIQNPNGTTDVIKDLIQDMNPDVNFDALNPNTPIQTLSSDAMDKLASMVDASFSAEQPTELQQAFIDSRNDPTGAHHFSEGQIRSILEAVGS